MDKEFVRDVGENIIKISHVPNNWIKISKKQLKSWRFKNVKNANHQYKKMMDVITWPVNNVTMSFVGFADQSTLIDIIQHITYLDVQDCNFPIKIHSVIQIYIDS